MEDEGLATVAIALVRRQAEQLAPPRALWVPFPLGRPFGAPDQGAFQRRVLRAALDLLERSRGPVLEDFPDDAPALAAPGRPWQPPFEHDIATPAADTEAVIAELAALAPRYRASVERRGRTTVGASGLEPEAAARLLGRWLAGERPPSTPAMAAADALRLAAEDLKSYYFEAAGDGDLPKAQLADWYWTRTHAGGLVRALRLACLKDGERAVRHVGDFMLVPEGYCD